MSADTTTEALSPELAAEFERNQYNPCVGQILVSESDRARVWYIRLKPGERIGFHRHVLDYFWTCLTAGKAASRINGGPPQETSYTPGMTKHLTFRPGEYMVHDLENTGDTELIFNTVEHLESANRPIPLPEGVAPTNSLPSY
ncbi:cupin domain-containing protein [Acuticoccus kandeliae]|uniref:cupin domain-containing protein n=1 Tax=Acuticoccus kandeliae TaxID=2073160 RepID=UPI000D3EC979|nr:hypothetical protein [Acuticoccus kandeliae]